MRAPDWAAHRIACVCGEADGMPFVHWFFPMMACSTRRRVSPPPAWLRARVNVSSTATAAASAALALGMALGIGLPSPSAAQPATVVVTASRFADTADQLPYGVSVLTALDLQRSGVSTVNEALMRLLGIPARLDTSGGGEYTLDLRGFGSAAGSNQVVVVDGLRLSEADLGSTRLAGIAIDSIERIEVLRGNGAVLYGEGATGGVIVITTKAGTDGSRKPEGQVYAAAGSQGLRELRGQATLVHGGWSLDASANRRLADGHRDNFASGVSGAALTAQWQDERFSASLRHSEDWLDTGLPGALTAAQYETNPRQTVKPDDHSRLHSRRSTLQASANLGDWTLALDGGWRDKASRSVFAGFGYDYDVQASQATLRARHRSQLAGLRNTLSLGLDANQWQRQVLGSFGSQAEQRSRALFIQDELQLTGGTRVGAGWRVEQVKKQLDDGFAVQQLDRTLHAWELSLLQPLTGPWALFGRLGDSFRLANVDEFSFTAPGASLRPQTSRDAELGLRWHLPGHRFELRAWRSALRDEIGFDPSVGNFGANVNFDRTRRQGVEAEASHSLGPTLNLRGTLAWRQARFTSGSQAGRDVPLVPARNATLGASWQPLPQHNLEADLRHSAGMVADFDSACRIPGATTLDLRYAVTVDRLELAVAVANATDRRFYTQAFVCVNGQTSAIYPETGRAFSASARLRF